jgi:hypothetical protein
MTPQRPRSLHGFLTANILRFLSVDSGLESVKLLAKEERSNQSKERLMEINQTTLDAPTAPSNAPRPKVLFLWDDDLLPQLAGAAMDHEFEVITVHSREQALAALVADPVYAIFLSLASDIHGGGNDFIMELDRLHSGIPVMIVTSAVSHQQVGDFLLLSDVPHSPWPSCVFAAIPLPITHETILNALNAVVSRGSMPTPSGTVPATCG